MRSGDCQNMHQSRFCEIFNGFRIHLGSVSQNNSFGKFARSFAEVRAVDFT